MNPSDHQFECVDDDTSKPVGGVDKITEFPNILISFPIFSYILVPTLDTCGYNIET